MATRKLTDGQMERLGAAIKANRENAGMSQAELSRSAGMSNASICEIEKARSGASLGSLVRIAGALGVEASDILYDAAL